MGPQAARSFPGQHLVKPAAPAAERAKQEIDYGRRGSGYVFGAFQPASGAAVTRPYERRTAANWVDFLSDVEAWIDPAVERVYAVVDNLSTPSSADVLLFSLLHPRSRVRFPADLRRLPQPDRALVEDPQVTGPERPPLRDLGRDRTGGRAGHRLLERA
jgi:hypothetical protein